MKTLRKTKRMRKHTLALLTVMVMLMATLLTACGSNQAAAPSTEAETTKVETAKAEETESVAPVETEEVVESTAEETAPTPETVVYEGIDMESTLPGLEWMDTFNGIIDEPKLIVFNDSTNKKVIVEEGQEVEMEDSDIMSIYAPKEGELVIQDLDRDLFNRRNMADVITLDQISKKYHNGDKVLVTNSIKYNGQEMKLTAVVVVKRDE